MWRHAQKDPSTGDGVGGWTMQCAPQYMTPLTDLFIREDKLNENYCFHETVVLCMVSKSVVIS